MIFPTVKQIVERFRVQPRSIVHFGPTGSSVAENEGNDFYVVAKLRQSKTAQQVNRERAQGFVNMCTTRNLANLLDEMRTLGVIQTQLPDEEERLLYKECKKYFGELCMVILPRDVEKPVQCTCELFAK